MAASADERRRKPAPERTPPPAHVRFGNRALELAETVVYVGIAVFLVATALSLLVQAADDIGKGPAFSDSMWEIGVLGVLVIVLGGTALLLRRKEREPVEGNEDTEDDPREGL